MEPMPRKTCNCNRPSCFTCTLRWLTRGPDGQPMAQTAVPVPGQSAPDAGTGAPSAAPKPVYLGDAVENALSAVGITKERVSRWLGAPCGCAERQAKLNRLDKWVRGFFGGGQQKEDLEGMIDGQ